MSFINKNPKVVVVTGATAGVGRATVREFAKKGAHIGLIARNVERLNETQQELEALGVKVFPVSADVSDYEKLETAAKLIEANLGPIEIWVNNAMVSVFSPAKEMLVEEYKRVTDVTYLGYVYGTLIALKTMLPRNRGTIIQVGSALAYRAIPYQSAYCAAKHAVQGFTDSIRSELIHDKSHVKITMVQMPALNTPQFSWVKNKLPKKAQPVPPIFQPEIAASAIVFAASHYRREWFVGWSTSLAIIGDKIAPGLGDWYLAKTAYKSQQYDGPSDPNKKNNLFQSVDGNFAAHGDFDNRAYSRCISLWLTQHRIWITMAFLLMVASWMIWHKLKN